MRGIQPWSLDDGVAAGHVAEDDAAQWSEQEHIDSATPQGGTYATAAYSTDRMRR
jgi:hypothetical protein